MVLHNDKWARKAKKAVERRKGTTNVRPRNAASSITGPLAKLDMNRPDADDAQKPNSSSESSESEDSFEFDSGDEADFTKSKPALQENLPQATLATKSESQPKAWQKQATSQPPLVSSKEDIADHERIRRDKRFSRRKLVDNSSRYEESELDPYLEVAEQEPEIDYRALKMREFSNPKQIELVPIVERGGVSMMHDTSHFERMKQTQQKEEYARDMRRRFGQRNALQASEQVSSTGQDDDDDAFFQDIAQNPEDTHQTARQTPYDAHQHAPKQGHESLEPFLDDLLRF